MKKVMLKTKSCANLPHPVNISGFFGLFEKIEKKTQEFFKNIPQSIY